MSIISCLISKAAEGKIDETELGQIRTLYEKHLDELSDKVSEGSLSSEAAGKTLRDAMKSLKDLTPELNQKLGSFTNQRKAIAKTLAVVDARDSVKLRRAQSTASAYEGLDTHIKAKHENASNSWVVDSYWENASRRKEFLSGSLMNPARDLLHKVSPNVMGVATDKTREASEKVLAGWFNPSSVDAETRRLADLLKDTHIAAFKMLREAGHPIPDPTDVRLPIMFDEDLMKKVGKDVFVQDMMRSVDIPYLLKQYPELMNRDMETVFGDMFRRMTGLTKADPAISYKNVARFTSITDQANFRDITSKYTSGHLYDNIIRHIDEVSTQTTLLEKAGANPKKLAEQFFDSSDDVQRFMRNYEYQRGNYAIKKDPMGIITGVRNLKQFLGWTQLGGTPVQAFIADPYTAAYAQYNTFGAKAALKSFVNQFVSPARYKTVTRDAERVAGMAELFTSITMAETRMMDGGTPSKWAQVANNAFYRYTGLTGITNAHKAMTLLETGWHMADFINAGKKLIDLPAGVQSDLRSVGLTDAGWDLITKDFIIGTGSLTKSNLDALSPLHMFQTGNKAQQKVAEQLGEFFHLMKERGTPTSSAVMKGRMASFGSQGSTQAIASELIGTYGGFVMSVYQNTTRKALNDFSRIGATGRLMAFGAGITVLDMLYRQTMTIARGDDPKEMDAKFATQSGMRSLPVPFAQNILNTFFETGGASVFGPVGGLGVDIVRAVNPKYPKEPLVRAVELADRYIPGGNVWYLSAIHKQLATPLLKTAIYGASDSMFGTKIQVSEAKREIAKAKRAAKADKEGTSPRPKKEKF
jgi:polyhydroxyalkanoate synthesis regulator phasin